MFNEKLLGILGQVSKFTEGVLLLKYPVSVMVTQQNDAMIRIPVQEADPEEFTQIGFNKSLNSFLSFVKLLPEDRTLTLENDIIYAKAGDISASFITDAPMLLESLTNKPEQFEETKKKETISEFTLTVDDIKKINTAASVFTNLPNVVIEGKDDTTSMFLSNTSVLAQSDEMKSNTYRISKAVNPTKAFKVSLSVTRFNLIPLCEYKVMVKCNNNRYRVYLENQTIKGLDVILFVDVVTELEHV